MRHFASAALFAGLGRDDYSVIIQEFNGRMLPEQVKAAIGAVWGRFTERHGAFRSVEVLGTVPETEAAMTYARLNFERGSEYRRCRWARGRLGYILIGAPPLIPTAFAPQSQTEFSGFHGVIGRRVNVGFDANAEEVSLIFVTEKERVTARKAR
ncbi:MAG TPA: hypothetical protein VNO70_01540 [Blastocatellia bacterium]|nr:hypothetical protein [Blastocatellia bacterium]